MLDNIKAILKLDDDSKDQLILLYIDKITINIFNYCNINELPIELESFVEDKVIEIVGPMCLVSNNGNGPMNTGEVKSVTRGDTKIEYNVSNSSATTSSIKSSGGTLFLDDEKKYLNGFRRLRKC